MQWGQVSAGSGDPALPNVLCSITHYKMFRNHAVDATIEFYRKPWLQHPTKHIKGDDASASSPTYYFTGYGRRQLLHHPLQQNTAAGAAEPEQPCHEQVLFPAGVDTPQHSQADTCAGAQPRKKLPKVIAPPIYSWASSTLAPQLGTRPISAAIMGWKMPRLPRNAAAESARQSQRSAQ